MFSTFISGVNWSCVILHALVCTNALFGQQRPKSLEKMVESRATLQTAKLEIRKTYYANSGSDKGDPRTVYESASIAGDRHLYILRGDERGIVIPVIGGGEASSVHGRSPLYRLELSAESWRRSDSSLVAHRFAHAARQFDDLRTLGAASVFANGDIHDVVWGDNRAAPSVPEYEESREGDLQKVRVRSEDFTRTYWLDPARGHSPVRVRHENRDGSWSESRSVLKLVDHVWFPASVHTFSSRYRDGREPTMVIEVDSAEFNRPEHPLTLTLADIGVDVAVCVLDFSTKPATSGSWDGEKVVSEQEFSRRLHAGELHESQQFKELFWRASGMKDNPLADKPAHAGETVAKREKKEQPKRKETEWEAYVREFIAKYRLDEAQIQQANTILRDCEDKANKYLMGRKADIERLDKQSMSLQNSDLKDKTNEAARLAEERKQLRKPIDDIFENELKPRLEKLPTSKQRADAENMPRDGKKPKSGG